MPKASKKMAKSSSGGVVPAKPYSTESRKDEAKKTYTQTSNLIAPNTSIGQHFLKNPAVVNSIIQKSAVKVSITCIMSALAMLVWL